MRTPFHKTVYHWLTSLWSCNETRQSFHLGLPLTCSSSVSLPAFFFFSFAEQNGASESGDDLHSAQYAQRPARGHPGAHRPGPTDPQLKCQNSQAESSEAPSLRVRTDIETAGGADPHLNSIQTNRNEPVCIWRELNSFFL